MDKPTSTQLLIATESNQRITKAYLDYDWEKWPAGFRLPGRPRSLISYVGGAVVEVEVEFPVAEVAMAVLVESGCRCGDS